MKQRRTPCHQILVRAAGQIVLGEVIQPKSLPGFKSWEAMLSRCRTKNHVSYPRYGGRGIKVCARWCSFPNFYLDMGPRPTAGHSLDRIDPNGNYEPGNCRWATRSEQQSNKRNTVYVTVDGKPAKLVEIAKGSTLPITTIANRLRKGWALDAALAIPVHVKGAPQPHRKKYTRRKN